MRQRRPCSTWSKYSDETCAIDQSQRPAGALASEAHACFASSLSFRSDDRFGRREPAAQGGHLMPRDAGRMVSKLTAEDRPVFAHRWMVRVLDFARFTSMRCICPKHSQAAKSSASGACRCCLSAPPARSVAYLKFTPVIGVSRGLCLRLLRRAGWLGAGCAHIVKSLQAGPGRLPSSKR